MKGLEHIDDETDALDITFVKINDPRYAKKYGVNKLPALVYFRRKFPSIYRGEAILSFLQKTLFPKNYPSEVVSTFRSTQLALYLENDLGLSYSVLRTDFSFLGKSVRSGSDSVFLSPQILCLARQKFWSGSQPTGSSCEKWWIKKVVCESCERTKSGLSQRIEITNGKIDCRQW